VLGSICYYIFKFIYIQVYSSLIILHKQLCLNLSQLIHWIIHMWIIIEYIFIKIEYKILVCQLNEYIRGSLFEN